MFGMVHNAWAGIEELLTSLCELIIKWVPHERPNENDTITTITGVLVNYCRFYLDNATVPIELVDISPASKHILLMLYCLTLVISFVGNIGVMVIFAANKNVRSVTNVFLVSLALSDLLITCFTIPFSIFAIFRSTTNSQIQPFACKIVPYIQNVAAIATVLTLCCICLERYMAILYPLLARAITALQRIMGLTLGVWLIALISSIPHAIWHEYVYIPAFLIKPALSFRNSGNKTNENGFYYSYPREGNAKLIRMRNTHRTLDNTNDGLGLFAGSFRWANLAGVYEDIDLDRPLVMASFYRNGKGMSACLVRDHNRTAYIIFKWATLGILFLLPTLLMGAAYIRIAYRLWDRSFRLKEARTTKGINKSTKYANQLQIDIKTRIAKKVTAMLVAAMALFVLCWLPHLIFEAIAITWLIPANEATLNIRYYLEWLSVSNSCHNPILYTLLHEKFRRILVSLFRCKKNAVRPEENESPVSSRLPSNDPAARPCTYKSYNDRDSPSTVAINLTSSPIVHPMKVLGN